MKELIVLLVLGVCVFRFAGPVAIRFTAKADFNRRRNLWIALTTAAFIAPNFWLFAVVAIPLISWGAKRDSNPVAFYLFLLTVVPPIAVAIPVVGINTLFSLDIFRILSFCVLVPAAIRLRKARENRLQLADYLLLAWGTMHVLQYVPPDIPGLESLSNSPTNILRDTFLFLIDTYVLYYVVSRSCSSRGSITDAIAAFCVSGAVLAVVAIFESLKGWLLYGVLIGRWSVHQSQTGAFLYLSRAGSLRAQASAGHSIALGYLVAIALGFWLSLQSRIPTKKVQIGVAALFCFGLLAAYSRTPWLGALMIYFGFAALGRRGPSKLIKAAGAFACVALVISFTPLGDRIAKVVPFLGGSVDVGNVDYRERLAQRSWDLILENPFFGDQEAMSKMEDLRQGEGIIDLVNSYAGEALLHGCIALALWLGFFLLPLLHTYRAARRVAPSDPDTAQQGFGLVACMLGVLIMLASTSFIIGVEKMFYVLAGLATAYSRVNRPRPPR